MAGEKIFAEVAVEFPPDGMNVIGVVLGVFVSLASSRTASNGVSPRGQHSTSCEFSATTKSSLLIAQASPLL